MININETDKLPSMVLNVVALFLSKICSFYKFSNLLNQQSQLELFTWDPDSTIYKTKEKVSELL